MQRKGKIARQPLALRTELNLRLAKNADGAVLLEWLNAIPGVPAFLAREFGGEPITRQNLYEWRQGGFLEWETQPEMFDKAHELAANAGPMDATTNHDLAEQLAAVIAGKFASLQERLNKYCGHSERGFLGFGEASVREQGQSNPVTEPKRSQNPKRPLLSSIQPDGYSISLNALPGWDGTEDQAFDAKLRVLTKFNQNLAILRRTNHSAARLKMEQAPFEREEQRLVAEAAREEERLALLVVGRIP